MHPPPPPYRAHDPYVPPQYSHEDPGQLLVEDADESGQVYIDLDIGVEDIENCIRLTMFRKLKI